MVTPGFFDPMHLARMKFEDLPPGFYEKLILDYDCGSNICEAIMFIRPRTLKEMPWSMAANTLEDAACSFLCEKGCTLPRDLMPICCLATSGCKPMPSWLISTDVAKTIWDNEKGRQAVQTYVDLCKTHNPEARIGKQALIEERNAAIAIFTLLFLA
jgi:hypothetical protein